MIDADLYNIEISKCCKAPIDPEEGYCIACEEFEDDK